MGKLIKNHWARLILLTASIYQVAAALEGFFWPKIFWDFATKNLDGAVKPLPILQILNLLFGIVGLLWEWPVKFIAGTSVHRSIEARLAVYPLSALMALLLYQGTNAGVYYLVGIGVYFWAYSEGKVCCFYPRLFGWRLNANPCCTERISCAVDVTEEGKEYCCRKGVTGFGNLQSASWDMGLVHLAIS
jgi:hypothetical protein